MKLTAIILAGCSLVLFAACKKNDNNSESNNSNSSNTLSATAKLLVAGKWQVSGSTASFTYMGKDSTEDIFDEMKDCEKDDIVTYTGDGKSVKDESANVCPGKSQTSNATWALLNNDTRLAIVDSNPDTFDLDISSTQMKLKYTENSSGTAVTYALIFKNIK